MFDENNGANPFEQADESRFIRPYGNEESLKGNMQPQSGSFNAQPVNNNFGGQPQNVAPQQNFGGQPMNSQPVNNGFQPQNNFGGQPQNAAPVQNSFEQQPQQSYNAQPQNNGFQPQNAQPQNAQPVNNGFQQNPNNGYNAQPQNNGFQPQQNFGNQPYGNQPYGNQPYGNQAFGNQPYGMQPKKSNTGLVVGIIAAVFVILLGIVGVTLWMRNGDTSLSSQYEITAAEQPIKTFETYINDRDTSAEDWMRLFIPEDTYDKFEGMLELAGVDIEDVLPLDKIYGQFEKSVGSDYEIELEVKDSEELTGSEFDSKETEIKSMYRSMNTTFEIEGIQEVTVNLKAKAGTKTGSEEVKLYTYCVDGKWYLDAVSLSKLKYQ